MTLLFTIIVFIVYVLGIYFILDRAAENTNFNAPTKNESNTAFGVAVLIAFPLFFIGVAVILYPVV